MSFAPEKLYFKLLSAFLPVICLALFVLPSAAQKRKPAAKTASKQTTSKETAKTTAASKSKKPTKAELAQQAAVRREAAEREAERRAAVLAEQRRREAIAREARQRQIAFERGLRTETVANIVNDDVTGEDMEVRRAAIGALGTHAGTIVVMEAQTGKILSIVNQDWAIRKGFKPCSTIKLVTGVAGINENSIDENGDIRSRNFPVDLDDALAHSNNSYFQKVGADLGSNIMISYAKTLGLGEQTGINAAGEYAGKLPYGNNNARIYSHGDDFEVTPLQLAVLVSAIANGGKKVVPQIPRTSIKKANFHGAMRGEVNVQKEKLQRVLPGMIGAVNYGTARRSGAAEFNAAGKTGSCIAQGSWVGLFASVAPVVDPKYSVVVITRGASERGKYASEIAGKVYRALGARINENGGRQELIAKVPLQLKPQNKVNAKTSALVDNDEGEDSDEGDVNSSDIKKDIAKRANPKKGFEDAGEAVKENQVIKTPVKSAPKSSLFPSVVISVGKEPTRPRVVPMNNK